MKKERRNEKRKTKKFMRGGKISPRERKAR
jgi:hypothetical protein